MGNGVFVQTGNARRSKAAFRHVDDPKQAQRIQRIEQDVQIRDKVADLAAIVKFQPADHRIRDAHPHEPFFNGARLDVRTIQYRHITVRNTRRFLLSKYFLRDISRFVPLVLRAIRCNRRARGVFRPKIFRLPFLIICNDGVRRRQNRLRRAVILLQPYDRRFRIVLLKIQDIADIRTAPAVNRLVRVANDAKISVPGRQELRKLILGAVRVLILVHENILKPLLVFFPHFFRRL